MRDQDCIRFLQWALPRLRMRWPGFRKVRRQVCKRLTRRLRELGLQAPADYRRYVEAHSEEWGRLDSFCRITISRFYRDKGVFRGLGEAVLPQLAARLASEGSGELRAWSIGCAGGEEACTLKILWALLLQERFPSVTLSVLGTDTDRRQLARARAACYSAGSLKELPGAWREEAFERHGDLFCLRPAFRENVGFRRQDVRCAMPDGGFHLILCRYLVFTYFDETLQRSLGAALQERLAPGGFLVLGKHEALPPTICGLEKVLPHELIYRAADR